MDFLYILIPLLLIIIAFFVFKKKSTKIDEPNKRVGEDRVVIRPELQEIIKDTAPTPAPKKEISFSDRLKKGLARSRQEVWGKLSGLFSSGLDDNTIDSIEELLYGADIGTATVGELIEEVKKKTKEGALTEESFKTFLFDFLKSKMEPIQEKVDNSLYIFDKNAPKKTKVIMVVGVNGAGKTTTIGKLATKLRAQGATVVVGACDTFRAAAVDQLQVWCDRAGATMIRAKEGANPSGVGYDALQAAINQNADYCILDTAGRLHTKENLMDELAKSKNVLKKLDEEAPHQILLVIDAITGQNALRQAEEFHKTLGLTGLIFTKCDGSSKAGSAVTIVEQLKLPITYIGVGESAEDLDVFNVDDYLHALLGT
jgi:fused signal recognition particle receptor